MKIIYEPKEFILDKELNEQENEIQFGRYLNQYHKTRKEKLEKLKNNPEAKENGVNLVLGTDCIAADKFANDANTKVCPANAIPEGWEGLDAGPETRKAFAAAIENAKTILWNGPAGVFEFDNFIGGSKAIADAIAKATANGAFSLIGGGDSVACINKFGMADQVSYISTGGGALLEAIEGKVLPGVAAIKGE